jgi:hypothetical protein
VALALVVHVAVVELRELGEGLVGFFDPVAHDFRAVAARARSADHCAPAGAGKGSITMVLSLSC